LQSGKPLSSSGLDLELLRELHLLTAKPFLYVFNVDAAELNDGELRQKLAELALIILLSYHVNSATKLIIILNYPFSKQSPIYHEILLIYFLNIKYYLKIITT
jgi:hypothetical protein